MCTIENKKGHIEALVITENEPHVFFIKELNLRVEHYNSLLAQQQGIVKRSEKREVES